ncbi:MAG: sugar kinase [Spirochaetaceae bacterium]|nr:MAG: sugar kinase [Spirochaetaceae bacterium]
MTLGIDIGTYSSKAVLIDSAGVVRAEAQTPHDMSIPAPGRAEHDAESVWWRDLVLLCRKILEQGARNPAVSPSAIDAVAVSAIGPCVLPVDRNGVPLRPAILYGVDTRAHTQIDRLNRHFGADWIMEQSGTALSSQSAGPKIRWIRDEEPHVAERTWKYMTSTTYLVYRLTGSVVIDHYTAAFFDPLYDLKRREWSAGTGREICTPDTLPDLMWTTETAGTITKEAAAETGLPEGIPVTAGTADAASEAISAGVFEPGNTMLMYGSSMFLIAVKDRLPTPGIFWSAPFLFPNTFALAAGMATTGSLTQWFRTNFAHQEVAAEASGGVSAYQALASAAESIPPGSDGLISLPYFSGERTPINDPDARGLIAGLNLTTTRAHVYRSLLEGVAYGIRHNLEEMAGDGGRTDTTLTAVGGGTQNRLWLQIVSDVLGQTQVVRRSIGAAFGDALLAALSVGAVGTVGELSRWISKPELVTPNAHCTRIYDQFYPLFRELYSRSAPVVHAVARLTHHGQPGRTE